MSTPEETTRQLVGLVASGWYVKRYRQESGALIWPAGTRDVAEAAGETDSGDEIVGVGITLDSAIDNLVGQMREQGKEEDEDEPVRAPCVLASPGLCCPWRHPSPHPLLLPHAPAQ